MTWRETQYRDIPEHTLSETDQLMAGIFAARGVVADSERNIALAALAPISGLGGLQDAVLLLSKHRDGRIMIVGDFDADGATSTALMLRGLAALGFAHVDFIVPNRFDFGYGLSPEIVDVALAESPTLIVTVDNGISSVAGVARAREHGVDVLVTDHHLPPDALPDANVIVNPNVVGDLYPSKNLAGVGVAFCVLAALARDMSKDNPELARMPATLLDLVALGTVADVVPLDRNNRILVAAGLQRIRAGKCVPGIAALFQVAKKDRTRVVATDLGFTVGPRLNAAGRLEDMSVGIRCLATDDPVEARALAERLDSINRERRSVESDMQEEALRLLETMATPSPDTAQFCVSLYDPGWHQGVVGLVASRIKERIHRPVFAFARESEGASMLKGSGRSIPGVHLRDVLALVAGRHPGLIVRFGGHAMAAGLTLAETSLELFSETVNDVVAQVCPASALAPTLAVDGELDAEHLSLQFASTLRDEGPWGQQFAEPVFVGEFEVCSARVVGEHHLKLTVAHDGATLDAIAFNQLEPGVPEVGQHIELAYSLDVNEWRGQRTAQLMVAQWRYAAQ